MNQLGACDVLVGIEYRFKGDDSHEARNRVSEAGFRVAAADARATEVVDDTRRCT